MQHTLLSEPEAGPSTPKLKKMTTRGTMNVITPEVAAALDRTNTSDRKAVHILSAMASTGQLKQDVEELIIRRSAIRRARMKHRELFTSEIKASFDPAVPLIMHWDGKIMEDFTGPGRERVDRLPILVSGQNLVKLLSVPKLLDGTAVTMLNVVVDSMDERGSRNRIKGLCLDTTASNAIMCQRSCWRMFSASMMCRSHPTWSYLDITRISGLV